MRRSLVLIISGLFIVFLSFIIFRNFALDVIGVVLVLYGIFIEVVSLMEYTRKAVGGAKYYSDIRQKKKVIKKVPRGPDPDNWTRHENEDGIKYFYNSVTKESRWERPDD